MTVFYVICFDVHDDKRLRKISNEMENFGARVQRSVFECHLEVAQLQELQQRLSDLMEPAEDQVRYYRLCGKDKQQIVIDGAGWLSTDPDYTIL
ncbi:MAG: CRISPR-associated endonuclease Cas2 [Methylococcaceae bacterium]|jgi:CRISPR-associated protein Cas2